jgi:cation diffusion facilitator family transporter
MHPSAQGRDRTAAIVSTLVLALVLNVTVAALKLVYGLTTGTLVFTADGVHSLLDGMSNVIGVIGMRAASKPPDEGHPYGHQRFEALAALGIAGFILAGLNEIVHRAFAAFENGGGGHVGIAGLGLAAMAFCVNLGISRYEAQRGKALKSDVLKADAGHTATDALGSVVIFISFAASKLGVRYADPVAALVIGALIAKTAWGVLRDNVDVLADARRVEPNRVRSLALGVDGVRGAHKVRSRGSREQVHLDLHIHVDPEMSVADAHALTHRVADRIREEIPEVHDVVIHTEPADGRELEDEAQGGLPDL